MMQPTLGLIGDCDKECIAFSLILSVCAEGPLICPETEAAPSYHYPRQLITKVGHFQFQ